MAKQMASLAVVVGAGRVPATMSHPERCFFNFSVHLVEKSMEESRTLIETI